METTVQPMLKVFDIAAIASLRQRHAHPLIVDNTFATPALQRPLLLGATCAVHSTPSTSTGTPTWWAAPS